uniref:Pyruvate:ferredoxin oxidoreductase PFO-4 n=1 Tax=Mastigamoeba balamuthi TaxID=108607 RepID=A0A0B4R368_MASBA|nr:pyruvate:ferredoxin oxidoreductase PFO-4 [Mastigamoeba balamuthi]
MASQGRHWDCVDGNKAATYVAYALSETCFIYPITPSSAMAEQADAWSSGENKRNCMGSPVVVAQMQSECGAAGAVDGAAYAGALVSTFTASQGFMLMQADLVKMAGGLVPAVFHVAARQVAGSTSSIFGEHSDVMAARSSGAMILSSSNVQEVHDNALVAHISALRARLPIVHFFEGFQVSHEMAKIELLDYEMIAKLAPMDAIAAHRERASHPAHPNIIMALHNRETLFQTAERPDEYWDAAPRIVSEAMEQVSKVTGRPLKTMVYTGPEDADTVIVIMGAAAGAAIEATTVLPKTGVLRVVLYRPWSQKHFLEALSGPLSKKTLRYVAVLDRTKDGGSCGEPLFLDVSATLSLSGHLATGIRVIGGRYGLGDTMFTPSMARAVFEHARSGGRSDFIVGPIDDITGRSLAIKPLGVSTVPQGTRQCILWGFGSDGTVGATKIAAGLIAENTPNYVQNYTFFTAHKAGGITMSHLRFGPSPKIDSSCTYPILSGEADYVACHHPTYAKRYWRPLADSLAAGASFVVNWPGGAKAIDSLPAELKRELAKKKARVYAIDARAVSHAAGLPGGIINVVMQCAFLKIAAGDYLPIAKSVELVKASAVRAYKKKGPEVVKKNCDAIDMSLEGLDEVKYDAAAWQSAVAEPADHSGESEFVVKVKHVVDDMHGLSLPVSSFEPGAWGPNGTAAFDKRGIAELIPLWDATTCVQCTACSAVCPHAAIRPAVYTAEEAKALPAGVAVAPAKGMPAEITEKLGQGLQFRIQVSPLDCTGCGVCVSACPAKGAITMQPAAKSAGEIENWRAFTKKDPRTDLWEPKNIKMAQMRQPLFEFSSACGGCGETAHMKLLTQLFGERMSICNAPGCSSAISVTFGSNPYTTNPEGWGPSLRAPLFENNAEFGFGAQRAQAVQRHMLYERTKKVLASDADKLSAPLREALAGWVATFEEADKSGKEMVSPATKTVKSIVAMVSDQRANVPSLNAVYELRDHFVNVAQWIFGGDGWAYDINSGGLEHVLSCDSRVRVLVLDTEVYSNTGGQVSKATPEGGVHKFAAGGKAKGKKDLASQIIGMGHVYVAQCCLYANSAQVLRAMREADQHQGPAIIICYAPCIEHGIEGGSSKFVTHAKLAVETGYWPLFRYDPAKKPAMQIDCAEPKKSPKELLDTENRFVRLVRENPERAKVLQENLLARVQRRWQTLKHLAEMSAADAQKQ